MQNRETSLSAPLLLCAAGLQAEEQRTVFSLPEVLLTEGKKVWGVCNFSFSCVKTWLTVELCFLSFRQLQLQGLTLFSSPAVCMSAAQPGESGLIVIGFSLCLHLGEVWHMLGLCVLVCSL